MANGRFTRPDPYGGSYDLGTPQSLNRYSYVENDPVSFVDPDGRLLAIPISIVQSIVDWWASGTLGSVNVQADYSIDPWLWGGGGSLSGGIGPGDGGSGGGQQRSDSRDPGFKIPKRPTPKLPYCVKKVLAPFFPGFNLDNIQPC